MPLVEGRIDTLAVATNFVILALLPALTAVMAVSEQAHTLVLTAVWPGAALGTANPMELLASQSPSVLPWVKERKAV